MTYPNSNTHAADAQVSYGPAPTDPASLPSAPPVFPAPNPAPTVEQMHPAEVKANRKVLFVLDELENEKTSEPFVFEYQGEVFELLDPKDIDWQDLMIGQEQPRLMLHVIMPEDQRQRFLEKKLPMRKMEALLTRWQQHFGLPSAGEGDGSARS